MTTLDPRIEELAPGVQPGSFDRSNPPDEVLRHLRAIHLDEQSGLVLFGEAPGFAPRELSPSALWFRTTARLERLICGSNQARGRVQEAVLTGSVGGVVQALLLLLGVTAPPITIVLAALLEPIAVMLLLNGVDRFCEV
jgi:hypothetical protein